MANPLINSGDAVLVVYAWTAVSLRVEGGTEDKRVWKVIYGKSNIR